MPRKPTFIHRLRILRGIICKTQCQMAKIAGVSASAIKRIENRDGIELTPKLVERIASHTNICPLWLSYAERDFQRKSCSDDTPVDRLGEPYTVETFYKGAGWQREIGELTASSCGKCAKVFRLAARKGRLDSAWFIVEAALDQAWRRFKLGSVANEDCGEFEDTRIPDDLAPLGPNAREIALYLAFADNVQLLRQTLAPNLFFDLSRAVKEGKTRDSWIRQMETALEIVRAIKPLRREAPPSRPRRKA